VASTAVALRALALVIRGLHVSESACAAALTAELSATERALELVAQGVPFRDAYHRVAVDEAARRTERRG
jgi:argininosuccinate lyase